MSVSRQSLIAILIVGVLSVLSRGAAASTAWDLPDDLSDLSLQQLLTISDDRDSSVGTVYAILSPADPLPQGIEADKDMHNGSPVTKTTYTASEVASPNGVVVEPYHNAIILQGSVDPATEQGVFKIRYLNNGLTGGYNECDVAVKRGDDGHWHLYNQSSGALVTTALVKTWMLGISTITGICSN